MKRAGGNPRLVLTLGGAVACMFAFAFLLVPLYEVFCELTGLDSERLSRATEPGGVAHASVIDEDRVVKVEFVATTPNEAAWEFEPGELRIEVTPGAHRADPLRGPQPACSGRRFGDSPQRAADGSREPRQQAGLLLFRSAAVRGQ